MEEFRRHDYDFDADTPPREYPVLFYFCLTESNGYPDVRYMEHSRCNDLGEGP
jgi:hypothetical protein